ncbi:Ribosomal RNA small subunit methyltransferase A [bioreactor metagenome]|uniref:Ribosomal RNA small subunit methyltransferase A n=1 Tax=bioreactor metagenome TaxID=1076179 RepID=A0A645GKB6_9ZZZZ
MVAVPGTKQYGALSALVQCVSQARLCFSVPPSCFYPEPDVDSALLHIDTHRVRIDDIAFLNRTIKASFAMRRKTLANNLSAAFALTKAQIEQILAQMNIEPTARAEALMPAQFELLARQLDHAIKK